MRGENWQRVACFQLVHWPHILLGKWNTYTKRSSTGFTHKRSRSQKGTVSQTHKDHRVSRVESCWPPVQILFIVPSHQLHHLNVFLDTDGILKVGGQLRHSSLADSAKNPIVIPKEHHVTKLIIAHNHDRTKHQGKGFTINEIRSNGY